MGQAKKRGTQDERMAAAILRDEAAAEQKIKDDAEAQEIAKQLITYHQKYGGRQ